MKKSKKKAKKGNRQKKHDNKRDAERQHAPKKKSGTSGTGPRLA